jgi:hypothetical protein
LACLALYSALLFYSDQVPDERNAGRQTALVSRSLQHSPEDPFLDEDPLQIRRKTLPTPSNIHQPEPQAEDLKAIQDLESISWFTSRSA